MELFYESSDGIVRGVTTENELCHYGVKGMKWGIRRARKELRSGDSGSRDSGVARLNKHKGKVTKKIEKLDKKNVKLQKKRDKQIQKNDVKAAKMSNKAAKLKKKARGVFTSDRKAVELTIKAGLLEDKASAIRAKSQLTQAKIDKNRNLREAFNKGLSEIDRELAAAGRKYLKDD